MFFFDHHQFAKLIVIFLKFTISNAELGYVKLTCLIIEIRATVSAPSRRFSVLKVPLLWIKVQKIDFDNFCFIDPDNRTELMATVRQMQAYRFQLRMCLEELNAHILSLHRNRVIDCEKANLGLFARRTCCCNAKDLGIGMG